MADDEDEIVLDDEDQEAPAKGKKGLLFIIIGVVVLLAAGGGAFFMMSGSEEAATEEAAIEADEEGAEEPETAIEDAAPEEAESIFYEMPEFLVDLNNSGRGKSSFLKMTVTLELKSSQALDVLEAKMPVVRDNFVTYLRELRASDLSGSAGLYRLREELLLRVNQSMAPEKVSNILFREVIVQ